MDTELFGNPVSVWREMGSHLFDVSCLNKHPVKTVASEINALKDCEFSSLNIKGQKVNCLIHSRLVHQVAELPRCCQESNLIRRVY